jgi:hypothetical protein
LLFARAQHDQLEAGMLSSAQEARNRLGGAIRRGADPDEVETIRAELQRTRTVQYIEQVLAETPPLTAEDKVHLTRLLTGPAGDAA